MNPPIRLPLMFNGMATIVKTSTAREHVAAAHGSCGGPTIA
jgi:hypothetical protein